MTTSAQPSRMPIPQDTAQDPDDLPQALRNLASRHGTAEDPIDCRMPKTLDAPITRTEAAVIYRVCAEAVDNAVRHSGARRIAIELHVREDRFVARVLDDGIGLEEDAFHGTGLLRMGELARSACGRLDVRSAPHAGTCVCVTVPRTA